MEERIDIPDPDAIDDLATARFLLRTLVATAEAQAATIGVLSETIESLRHEIAELRRALFGQKRERVEPVEREIARKKRVDETPEQAEARRQKTRKQREQTREGRRDQAAVEVVDHC